MLTQSCKADETKGHNVRLKIHKDKPNEMTRQDHLTTLNTDVMFAPCMDA